MPQPTLPCLNLALQFVWMHWQPRKCDEDVRASKASPKENCNSTNSAVSKFWLLVVLRLLSDSIPSCSFHCTELSPGCKGWQTRATHAHIHIYTLDPFSPSGHLSWLFFFSPPQTPISTKLSGTEGITWSTIIRCKSRLKDRSIKVGEDSRLFISQGFKTLPSNGKNKHFKISFSFHLRP